MTPRIALLFAALVASASLPAALADEGEEDAREDGASGERDEDGSDEDDKEWEEEPRELDVRTSGSGFEYESQRETSLAKDEIRARFDAESSRFRFDYDAEGGEETDLSFRVEFVALLEHEDDDADGAYDVGERVLRRIALGSLRPTLEAASRGGLEVVDATYALQPSGSLTLRFHVVSEGATVDGVSVTPTQAKYDVQVDGYSWSTGTSRLALETRTRTTLETEFDEDDEGEPGIEFARGRVAGFYRWVNTTLVDGRVEPVGATVLAQRTSAADEEFAHESVVVFSYVQGASITHDPSFGVERLAEAAAQLAAGVKGEWRVFAVSLGATAAILLATALPRLRRRG